ncbi:hypothetical protein HCN44_001744 [Aphidius gifuensis]|uniref:Uncharacterized protein n=1 Tax=Aphidius gifuensis TaxID=684658 RepID=A0A835CR32_APHGI|nr:hypothetical protein HCN44_001744 [Aphidius gifuensis]
MGAPSIYVYDCSNDGSIVDSFKQFAEQHEKEYENEKQNRTSNANSTNKGGQQNIGSGGGVGGIGGIGGNCNITMPSYKNCIQLAACAANQILPMNPDLPVDIFTSCLTTPIKIALHWFVMQNTSKLVPKISLDLIDKIPGQLSDRRTMLGELNWIFTAITNTIAWNTLPRDLFQKLCRQDLLVASLFRNFLFAGRILRSYDCTPVSCPQHLTAFGVWLTLGSKTRNPPEQLPIVLQVLLSEAHRLRALKLLGKFLNLGPWTVNLALSVVRDNGHKYFLSVLQDTTMASEHRTLATFVLACIINNYTLGQEAALQGSIVSICLEQLMLPRCCGVRDIAHEELSQLLNDPIPEVRTACVFALVTKELIVALQWIILHFKNSFVTLAITEKNSRKDLIVEILSPFKSMRRISSRDRLKIGHPSLGNLPSLSYGSVYMKLWHSLCVLDNDPHPGVANMSQKITTHIRNQIKDYTKQKYYHHSSTLHSTAADVLRTTNMLPRINRGRKPIPNLITEEACNETPLTTTQFVNWSCAQFAQPVSFDNDSC